MEEINANVKASMNVKRKVAVLSGPMRLESESSESNDYRAPNLIHRVLSLLKNVCPGTDLTRFQLPPMFNMPKSMLQCYGETLFCINKDLLGECANGESPVERLVSVVKWTISTTRPLAFGVAPYNPILGETHHVSRGSLNVLLEQISHHPPVSALHATDEITGIEMIWCHRPLPKFNGTAVITLVQGERKLKLSNKGENYIITHPNLMMKFIPWPSAHWLGNIKITCKESGFEADLCFGGSSFLGRTSSNRSIRGKIYLIPSLKTIYEIDGHWDRIVTVKDVRSGKNLVIHDAKEVISGLKTPILKNAQGLWASESALVWGEVNQHIMNKNWDKAREAKTGVEERERVSHHPPVSALHATDEKTGIEMIWCHRPLPKFNGTAVETLVQGERKLKLTDKGENYIITHPNLVMKFIPWPGAHWLGNITITCKESGFEADLCFGGNSFLGRTSSNRSIRGKIYLIPSLKTIFEIQGHWDRIVTVKDVGSGKSLVIHDAKEVISGLKTPILKNPQGLWASESALVWGEVNQHIMNKNWDKAREAKTGVEERERELVRERKAKGETWVPKHFTVLHTSESGGWDCLPKHKLVPRAPIVVPILTPL